MPCACEIKQLFSVVPCVELYINLTLALLQKEHLTNGEQLEEGHVVIQTHMYVFPWLSFGVLTL